MKKMRNIAKNLFKNFFRFLFKLIYGKIIYNKDNLKSENIHISELKNPEIINFFKNKYKVYKIINGRVYTDTVESVAIIDGNNIVDNVSYQQIVGNLVSTNKNIALKNGTPRLQKKLNGKVFSLVQGASGNNFFHFLFDILPKLKLLEKVMPLNEIDYFYLPSTARWQIKILSNFSIQEDRVINSQKYRHIAATEILTVDHPWYQKGNIQEQTKYLPEWIIFFLRDKFLKYSKKFNSNEKIFIDRSDSNFNHCKLINNDEVINFLSTKGFTSYQTSKLDFFEQIYLFSNAKIIIGPHGAAFSNIVFSKPSLKLIELIPSDHPSIKCKRI